ncbi:MAG: hypothetical protein IPP98_03985 [Gemmatimonadetes bacterium]|nr:hypothetical protein [Gemmatimonadota bacterium]
MAAIGAYQMEERAEIQLARSAAPTSISSNATILVLGPQGYRTAVEGTNGFVCMVARSWMAAFDWPEFYNPKVRAADCMNRQAARTILPIVLLRSRLAMAGRPKAEILAAIKAAVTNGEVPALQSGAMSYMMSRTAYLTDEGTHNMPHVMFFTAGVEAEDWGAAGADSPFMAAPYWFFSSTDTAPMQGLPPMLVFLIGVANWSDGTPAHP